MNPQTVAVIGAGNVASHLSEAFVKAGHMVKAVYSRTNARAKELADRLESMGCDCTSIDALTNLPQVDLYLLAISDDALPEIVAQWPQCAKNGIVVHTAGSIPMQVLEPLHCKYGVFYPLQTFTKGRELDFSTIPFFIEAANKEVSDYLMNFARTISDAVVELDSERRAQLHLSAVFACNFVNHLYDISSQLLENKGVDAKWLHPLIQETALKALSVTPRLAQTGPAIRGNQAVMSKHLQQLSDSPIWREIYALFSNSIFQTFHP